MFSHISSEVLIAYKKQVLRPNSVAVKIFNLTRQTQQLFKEESSAMGIASWLGVARLFFSRLDASKIFWPFQTPVIDLAITAFSENR